MGVIFYQGEFSANGTPYVSRNGVVLTAARSRKIRDHSPDGFSWGYCGSGPAQLALALLFDVTYDSDLAQKWYQQFKSEVVAGWDSDKEWSLSSVQIADWVVRAQHEEKRAKLNPPGSCNGCVQP